ncbi:unnamed protein product, partial [Onchocerca ochengi]
YAMELGKIGEFDNEDLAFYCGTTRRIWLSTQCKTIQLLRWIDYLKTAHSYCSTLRLAFQNQSSAMHVGCVNKID